MRIHSLEKIKKLKELRKKGYSINELVRELSIPKTTVWHHIQGIEITPKYLSLLRSKIGGSRQKKEKNLEIARQLAKEILKSSNREYIIAFTMLYWAEGSKKSCDFVNSDGRMINLCINILVKIFNISKDRLTPTIRIFSGMDKKECLNYWSKITGLPKSRFFVRMNDGGIKSKTKYGMCRIMIKKGSNTLKLINSLVDQSYTELINSF